jgi:hypothetical protein
MQSKNALAAASRQHELLVHTTQQLRYKNALAKTG